MEWKIPNYCDEIEFGRVKKKPTALCDHHASGVDPPILAPPVQGDVSPDVS